MKSLGLTKTSRSIKESRIYRVLLGLVAHDIENAKAVGSHTLKEAGFQNLSSATLRNYFSQLEEEGYLHQLHSSGGRIPTEKAYRLYANEIFIARNWPSLSIPSLSNCAYGPMGLAACASKLAACWGGSPRPC